MTSPSYFGYLRVSRDTQDVANQRLGLLDYANKHGFNPLHLVDEVISRTDEWTERKIGHLLNELAKPGDYILTSEFTRLGGRPGQVFAILEAAAKKGVTIIITKTGTVMDGSLNAQIYAAAFSIASLVEIEFIRTRTKEGLQRARMEGRVGGRPKGSTGKSKLDPSQLQIKELRELGLSIPKLAKHFKVAEKTMRRFVQAKNI